MKSPKAPKQPDPVAVSTAQTQSNRDTAAYDNALAHGNTTTPFGSQTFTGRVDPTTGAMVYDQNVSLSPEQQQLYDTQTQQDLSLGQASNSMLDQVRNAYANQLDTSKLPGLQSSIKSSPIKNSVGTSGNIQRDLNVNGPNLVGNIDNSNLPKLYGADDLEGARQNVSDALYRRQSSFLDPQYQQRDTALRTRLANQGITEGSEAWKNSIDEFERGRSFDYGQARDSAIAGGLSEMQGLSGIASQNRGQLYGENVTGAEFQNSARNQALSEALVRGQFSNEGQNQQFGQDLAGAEFANNAQNQDFSQQLAAGQFGNQARTQGLNEELTTRSLPMNEYNALRTASQVNVPQFQNPNNATLAPTNTAQNTWNAYNGALQNYQTRSAQQGGWLQGLLGLGGAAIAASDERVKDDIEQIGELTDDLGLYEYEYKGDPLHERHTGVMAQEVEQIDPEAVLTGPDGVKRVDYKRVLAHALMKRAA